MSLAEALAAFDEDALVALANKGVVRRAARDVAEGKIAVGEWDGDAAIVAADGETVRIDARGPGKATCSCPAPGICRHRIAAVLLLQQDGSGEAPSADPLPSLIDEVAAIAEEALIRFAGRAAWRAGREIASAGAEVTEIAAALVIRLNGEDAEIRYLRGLGPDGMVSKVPPTRRKALHAAALIAVRRQAGIEPDEVAPTEAADVPKTIDPAFLADVRAALADAGRNGLALAPLALEERLFTLSVSSRADSLPRLAAMLRDIARMLRERRTRSLRFDPEACLGAIAAADALARALPAATEPAKRAGLAGSVRQDYAECGPLHLHGVGGEAWRSGAGARGASAYFYDPDGDRWFTASLARGAGQDPFFDPRTAFRNEALWGGHNLAGLSEAELRFDSVGASARGRLSAGAAARPELLGRSVPSRQWLCAFSRWDLLAERLRSRLVGSLAAPAPASEPVILWPRRTGRPWFDDLAQRLCWPLEDADGNWTIVSLDHDPDRAAHFDHLASTLFRAGFGGAIAAAASVSGTAFDLRPFALFEADALCSLDFAEARAPKRDLADLLRSFARRGRGGFVPRPKPAGILLLDEIAAELTGIAETGSRSPGASGGEALARLAGRAERSGFQIVAEMIERLRGGAGQAASELLGARYVVDQARLQLTTLAMLSIARS